MTPCRSRVQRPARNAFRGGIVALAGNPHGTAALLEMVTRQAGRGDIDESVLETAPSYGPRETKVWDDPNWERRVHDHYRA
jgi:hypothetical protein